MPRWGWRCWGMNEDTGVPPKSSQGCSQPLEPSHADAATVSGAVTGVLSPPSRPPPRAAALAPRCGGESRHIALPAGWCRAWPHVPAASSLLPLSLPCLRCRAGKYFCLFVFLSPGEARPWQLSQCGTARLRCRHVPRREGTGAGCIPPFRAGMSGQWARRFGCRPVPPRGVFSPKSPGGLDPSVVQSWGGKRGRVVRIWPWRG